MSEVSSSSIAKHATALNGHSLSLHTTSSPQSDLLETFCDTLTESAPELTLSKLTTGEATEPFISITNNLIFKAVPEGKILPVFSKLVMCEIRGDENRFNRYLKNVKTPVTLRVYITPHCPFCPNVVADVSQLSFASEHIHVEIIDGSLFPELAASDTIASAPTVIFNETFRWTGQINPEKIAEVIGNTKPGDLSEHALRVIIESGKASILAQMIADEGFIFPPFYALLTHEKWPVRLGAMVTLEELAEIDKDLCDQALTHLWNEFNSFPESIQGDILYITGETGGTSNLRFVKNILTGNYSDDLKEAASEAIESLNC